MTGFRSKALPHDLYKSLATLEDFASIEGVSVEELVRLLKDRKDFHDEHGWSRS